MQTYTAMAIDSFRAQEAARRRLVKAEAATLVAASRVQEAEKNLWFCGTEIVRLEADKQASEEAKDYEAAEACALQLSGLRRQMAELEKAASERESQLA